MVQILLQLKDAFSGEEHQDGKLGERIQVGLSMDKITPNVVAREQPEELSAVRVKRKGNTAPAKSDGGGMMSTFKLQ